MLWPFVGLLAVHWVADFVLQTHWQASNKSKRNDALLRHVCTYTCILGLASVVLFGWPKVTPQLVGFIVLNGALHFGTDWFTSRWSSAIFTKAMRDPHGGHWHNFFVLLGFDQLIHHVTLAATLYFVIGGFL